MRLIGSIATEKEAYVVYSLLLKEGIQNIYEPYLEQKTGNTQYRIWVYDEDDLEKATHWLNRYKENPSDPAFLDLDVPPSVTPPTPTYSTITQSEDLKWQTVPPSRLKMRRFTAPLTNFIIIVCALIYLWNGFEEGQVVKEKGILAAEIGMTPLEQDLLFDYPKAFTYVDKLVETIPLSGYKEMKDLPPDAIILLNQSETTPSWKGLYSFFVTANKQGWKAARSIPTFEKIRQGELWRLFTPCLMHANFLHILFNMAWVWILCKQIEQRISKYKICLLILIIAVISNVAQYIVSGPYFLGFSGVVVGMAGFIWVRQKKAPWEGYPLERGTLLFLLFFVLAMFALEIFTFGLHAFSLINVTPQIANTAHIVGGLVGILLGRFSFFGRKIT